MAKHSYILTSSLVWAMVMVLNDQVCQGSRLAPTYMETNEIVPETKPEPALPTCQPKSVCGYLQANANGINVEKICNCPTGSCPLNWDPIDGHSVTQGSDQYKTCDQAPTNLQVCDPRETAYTSRIVWNRATDTAVEKMDHIKCICPENYNYIVANQKFQDLPNGNELMDFTYVCAPLTMCQRAEPCKAISHKGQSFLVNHKCMCPMGETCPTVSDVTPQIVPFGTGHYTMIQCQAPR